MVRNARGRQPAEGGPALSIAATPDAEPDPLATWSTAMPAAILASPKLTDGGRLLAGYLWALAGHEADSLVRTTFAGVAAALAMPESSVRRYAADLHRAGYLSPITSRRGRPDSGGGAEFRVYGPAALGPGPRVHPPSDTAQGRLPLAAGDDLLDCCRATAAEIDVALGGGRDAPHDTYTWLVVAGALLANGVPLAVARHPGGQPYGPVRLARDDVLSAARDAGRRDAGSGGRGVGAAYYARMRERLSVAAGEPVRWPAQRDVRAACDRIGWPWRPTWCQSAAQLHSQWRAAQVDGDARTYAQWRDARDELACDELACDDAMT